MTCFKCGGDLNPAFAHCPDCGADNKAPHIRRAERPEERRALAERLRLAWEAASLRGSLVQLQSFEAQLKASRAVMVRWSADLDRLINHQSPIVTFYQYRDAGLRAPQDSHFDDNRESEDARINPHYYRTLNYAALSLDGKGVGKYGNFHLTWRDLMIEDRTTVFEENPFRFNERFPASDRTARLGYRATWHRRSDLGVAKLHMRIATDTDPADFAGILLEQSDADITDFVEVHIDGPLSAKALQHVIVRLPADPDDRLSWERLKIKLPALGITWDEI